MNTTNSDSLGLTYLLKSAELAVRSCAEVALAPYGLTPALFVVLFRLKHSEGVSSADLARAIGVRPQSIVELIQPLEKAGMIKRRRAPEHRRILRIALTAAGERLLERAIPAARALEEELFSSLSRQQTKSLREALVQLVASAQSHESHPITRRPPPAPPRPRRPRVLANAGAAAAVRRRALAP